MKKYITIFYFLLFSLFCINLKAQQNIAIPDEIDFCGIRLILAPEVKQEMSSNVNSIRQSQEYFQELLDRTDTYFRIIDKIFDEYKIHADLKYIILHESGLLADAQGTGDVAGFWQISKKDALNNGLLINEVVDERLNIIESTKMIARQLQKYNSTFNNWIYSGLGLHLGLESAISNAEYKYYSARKMLIDTKTHWFIIKTISYKMAFSDSIGKNKSPRVLLFEYQAIKNQTLFEIADINHVSPEAVKEYNKWFSGVKIPEDKPYTVFVPLQSEVGIQQGIPRELYSNMPPPIFLLKNGLRAIQAKFGDAYEKIAKDGGITVNQLYEYNEIGPFNPIYHGQVCYLEKKNKKPSKLIPPFHVVKYSQTVWGISQYYGLLSSTIREYNWLSAGTELKPPEEPKLGQKLWLHQKRPEDAGIEIVLNIDEPAADSSLSAFNDQSNEGLGDDEDSDFVNASKENKPEPIPDSTPEKVKSDTNNNKEILLSNKIDETESQKSEVESPKHETEDQKPKTDSIVPAKKETVVNNTEREKNIPKKNESESVKNDKISTPSPVLALNTSKESEKSEVRGQKLEIRTQKPETQNQKLKTQNYLLHTVSANQNLFRISMLYKVSIGDIKKWNDLSTNELSLGQTLKIYTGVFEENGNKTIEEKGNEQLAMGNKTIEEKSKGQLAIGNNIIPTTTEQRPVSDNLKPMTSNQQPVTSVQRPYTNKNNEINSSTKVSEPKMHIVEKGETVQSIVKMYKITLPDLKKWNKLATPKITMGQKLVVSLPEEKSKGQLAISNNTIRPQDVNQINQSTISTKVSEPKIHLVKQGETVQTIMKLYKITFPDLKKWNNLPNPKITQGQKLIVSSPGEIGKEQLAIGNKTIEEKGKEQLAISNNTIPATSNQKQETRIIESGKVYHIVNEKETIFNIANKYKMGITQLMQLNNLIDFEIQKGQKLLISENEQSLEEKFDVHTVAAGETILSIATKYSCMVTEIMKWNNKTTMEIKLGEKLKIRK